MDSKSVSRAISMLRGFSDQREIMIRDKGQAPVSGSYLGYVVQQPERIEIYCDLSRPENLRQAIVVHEILHIVLAHEGYPEIVVNEKMCSGLPTQQQRLLTGLKDRFKSAIDHPEIFRRMTSAFKLDLDSYFEAQVDQKLRMFQSGSRNGPQRDQNYCFQRQQGIMWGIELFWYPTMQRDRILSAFQRMYPDSYQSCVSLHEKVKGICFQTPTSCYESAQIIRSHIISYGKSKGVGVLNRMWEALQVQKPDTRG